MKNSRLNQIGLSRPITYLLRNAVQILSWQQIAEAMAAFCVVEHSQVIDIAKATRSPYSRYGRSMTQASVEGSITLLTFR
jgi:hypothetical protein